MRGDMLNRGYSSILLTLGLAMVCNAAPPSVTTLYPAGGQRGTTFDITATGTFDLWPVKVWVSHSGIIAKAATDKGKINLTIAADVPLGVHYLRFHNKDGADALRPIIVGTLPEVLEREPNDNTTTAQLLETSSIVNGRLAKSGDVDCFAMKLKMGQTLIASIMANTTLGSPMDSVLQIVDTAGTVLCQNHDYYGLDPQIDFTAPKDGLYIARFFAFPSQPDSTIRFAGGDAYIYRLTLTTGPFLDYALPLSIANQSSDSVLVQGWNIPEIVRSVKLLSTESSTSVVTIVNAANSVVIQREPHPCYNVTTQPLQQIFDTPFTLSGRVASATSHHRFRGNKGKALSIRIKVGTPDRVLTPVLRILDNDGKQLARVEPPTLSGDCETTFFPATDGVFQVEVMDLYGKTGPRFVYALHVVPVEPDFGLTVTIDRFLVLSGKPLDVPVTIVKKSGFKQEIEITATNLPPGVTATPVPSVGKTDSAVVTLRFTAEKMAASFPFQIIGTIKGLGKPSQIAEVAGTTSDIPNVNLWMSVKD